MASQYFDYDIGDEDCCDPSWTLKSNPDISVQDARSYGGGFVINELRRDEDGLCSEMHGTFTKMSVALENAINLGKSLS